MPLAVFAIAIGGAFASQGSTEGNLLPETGWVDTPSPCMVQVECSDIEAAVCTGFYNGELRQAYAKEHLSDATCAKITYQRQ